MTPDILRLPVQLIQRKEVIPQIVDKLKAGFGTDLLAVILFGSSARSETSWNDIDFYVLLDVTGKTLLQDPIKRHYIATSIIGELDKPEFDFTVEDGTALFQPPLSTFLLDVAVDGVVLHDATGLVSPMLNEIQEFIQEHKLERIWGTWMHYWNGVRPCKFAEQTTLVGLYESMSGYLDKARRASDSALRNAFEGEWESAVESSLVSIKASTLAVLCTHGAIGRVWEPIFALDEAINTKSLGPLCAPAKEFRQLAYPLLNALYEHGFCGVSYAAEKILENCNSSTQMDIAASFVSNSSAASRKAEEICHTS